MSTRWPLSIAPVVGPRAGSWSGSARVQTHLRHAPYRLESNPPRHLRAPDLAVAEDDRDLAYAEAVADGAVGQLDLERVALRADGVEIDRLEHLAPVALESAGEVAHREPQHALGVPAPPARNDAAPDAPALALPAVNVARAEHDVGVVGGAQQAGEVGRVVGEIGIHLADERGTGSEGPPESREVGLAEPELRVAMKHLDLVGQLGRQAVGNGARAVGRGVVDDQHPMAVRGGVANDVERGAHDRLEVRGLVVGREDEPGGRGHSAGAYPKRRACPTSPTARSPPRWTSSATSTSSTARSSTASSPTAPRPRRCVRARPRWRRSPVPVAPPSWLAWARRCRRRSSRCSRPATRPRPRSCGRSSRRG